MRTVSAIAGCFGACARRGGSPVMVFSFESNSGRIEQLTERRRRNPSRFHQRNTKKKNTFSFFCLRFFRCDGKTDDSDDRWLRSWNQKRKARAGQEQGTVVEANVGIFQNNFLFWLVNNCLCNAESVSILILWLTVYFPRPIMLVESKNVGVKQDLDHYNLLLQVLVLLYCSVGSTTKRSRLSIL